MDYRQDQRVQRAACGEMALAYPSRPAPVHSLAVSVRPAERLKGTLPEEQRSGAVQPAAPSQPLGHLSGYLGFHSKQLAPPVRRSQGGWNHCSLPVYWQGLAYLRRLGARELNGHRARMTTVESNLAKAGLPGNSCQRAACPFTAPSGRGRQG
jgi:hypothetical protein